MATLVNIVDKYSGKKLCDLSLEETNEFLGAVAQSGATKALAAVGLSDEFAAEDIRSIRDLMKGFKVIRKTAMVTLFNTVGRVLAWAVIISLAGYFIHTSDTAKSMVETLVKP